MLQPCTQCNRHIVETEAECPFCGAPNEARPRATSLLEGRLSRAAVFASTVLVAPACVVSEPPPPQYPQQQYQQQQPPPPPPDDQNYAQPPPDDANPPPPPDPVQNTAGVHVTARWSNGNVYTGPVQLNGPVNRVVHTNARGEVVVRDLPAGRYRLIIQSEHPRHSPTVQSVELRNDAIQSVVMTPYAPVYDRSNIPKPYGAPPARKRVV